MCVISSPAGRLLKSFFDSIYGLKEGVEHEVQVSSKLIDPFCIDVEEDTRKARNYLVESINNDIKKIQIKRPTPYEHI